MKKTEQWWEPHPLDKYDQWRLLEIAESANPPNNQSSDSDDWCGDVEFIAKDGWKVIFFYDCGELDYIDSFVTPEGMRLEVFVNGYQSEQWPPVMNWRSVGDLTRLKALLTQPTGGTSCNACGKLNLMEINDAIQKMRKK